MKVVRFIDENGQERLGCDPVDGTAELLDGAMFDTPTPTGQRVPTAKLLAPLSPPNIYGIGLNYREHAKQMGAAIPEHPVVFMKPTTAIANPGDAILVPKCCTNGPEVDYECELGVVIGRTTRDVTVDTALDHVFGYTVANEVSARKWSSNVSRTRGKIFDRFCPLGPMIVTADEIGDPQDLQLRTTVNDALLQDGHTSDMIFPVAHIISYLSQDVTLLPGTLILTGSPPGSGVSRTPPVFLQPGDQVHVEIPGIGRLSNPVDQEASRLTTAA